MFENLTFVIQGTTPHVQRNGQLADPQNYYVIEIKKITSKMAKKRTEDDISRLDNLEWEGSLYLNDQKRVIVPGTVIEGALFEAGKSFREGPTVRNGLQSPGEWLLEYDGPKDLESLRADPEFWFRCSVRLRSGAGKVRVMRTRPIFRRWALRFSVQYHPGMLSKDDIIKFVHTLGDQIGLSDDRHKMGGRFVLESVF